MHVHSLCYKKTSLKEFATGPLIDHVSRAITRFAPDGSDRVKRLMRPLSAASEFEGSMPGSLLMCR
jgi:hypothetical protein